ncbi:MAG: hypothetical protein V3V08_22315 [Nannocystaceae bacterium]
MQARDRERIVAALAVALVALGGVSLAGLAGADSARRADVLLDQEVPAHVAQDRALARDLTFKRTKDYFSAGIKSDAEAFGVPHISLESLSLANHYERTVIDRRVLGPGQTLRSKHLKVTAAVRRVTYAREGVSVKTRHLVARVENTSSRPVAYFMRVNSVARGECKVRGVLRHNAMALLPRGKADVVVCAGRGKLAILDLRELEITELGYVYLSKLPPLAVGHDLHSVRAHHPGRGVKICSQVPAERLRRRIVEGSLRWQDVADFYARHNCDRKQFVDGYSLATRTLAQLPYRAGSSQ